MSPEERTYDVTTVYVCHDCGQHTWTPDLHDKWHRDPAFALRQMPPETQRPFTELIGLLDATGDGIPEAAE